MKQILILEDIPAVVEALKIALKQLEEETGEELEVTVYTTSREVEDKVNHLPRGAFDAIVLDRNTVDGSFHVLDIEKFGPERIVSISSLPHLNRQFVARGVQRSVDKDHSDLTGFSTGVIRELRSVLEL